MKRHFLWIGARWNGWKEELNRSESSLLLDWRSLPTTSTGWGLGFRNITHFLNSSIPLTPISYASRFELWTIPEMHRLFCIIDLICFLPFSLGCDKNIIFWGGNFSCKLQEVSNKRTFSGDKALKTRPVCGINYGWWLREFCFLHSHDKQRTHMLFW